MKKMYLCATMVLFIVAQSYSQQSSGNNDALYINEFNQAGQQISSDILRGADASVNLQELIDDRIEDGRIRIFGSYTKDGIKYQVNADSKDMIGEICIKEEPSQKPMFGIAGESNEDFTGLIIKKVAKASPADKLGLVMGDILYYLGDDNVTTYCDLYMAVNSKEVGEVVQVEFEKNGKTYSQEIIMGATPIKTVSLANCSEIEQAAIIQNEMLIEITTAELTVFPNPTSETTFVRYESDSNEGVTLLITDSNGALIHKREIDKQENSLNIEYTFESEIGGLYLFVIQQGDVTTQSKVLYLGK